MESESTPSDSLHGLICNCHGHSMHIKAKRSLESRLAEKEIKGKFHELRCRLLARNISAHIRVVYIAYLTVCSDSVSCHFNS